MHFKSPTKAFPHIPTRESAAALFTPTYSKFENFAESCGTLCGLCINSLMVSVSAVNSLPCTFLSLTWLLESKAFSCVNVALVCAVHLQQVRAAAAGNPVYSHSISPRCIRMRLDYAKCLFTQLRAKRDGNRDIWLQRVLSLFVALLRWLLPLCCVVLWPRL